MSNRSQQKLHIEVAQKASHVMSLNQTSHWPAKRSSADNIDNPYMSRKWEGRLFLTQKPVGFYFQESSTQKSQPQMQGILNIPHFPICKNHIMCVFAAFWLSIFEKSHVGSPASKLGKPHTS